MNREQQTMFAAYLEMTGALGHLGIARRYLHKVLPRDELDAFDSLCDELTTFAGETQGKYHRPLPIDTAKDPS